MNVPSQVPTSFVPHTAIHNVSPSRMSTSFYKILVVIVYGILVVAMFASVGVFSYEHVLQGKISTQKALLNKTEKTVDVNSAQNFLHLRDQLTSIHSLLNSHVTFSRFFDVLEKSTVQDVSFNGLSLRQQNNKTTIVTASGIALNFDALAAESKSLAQTGAVSNIEFSGISVNKDGSVNFKLDAVVKPGIIADFSKVVANDGSVDNSQGGFATTTTATTTVTQQTP